MFTAAIAAIVLAYTWLVGPMTPRGTAYVAGTLVVTLAISRALKTGEWGLRPSAFLPALWRTAACTAAGALVLLFAGSRVGTWHGGQMTATAVAVLIAWGLGQQFVLQTVILREAEVRIGANATYLPCVAAAVVFAALHLPNPFLAAVTFLGALAWCWIYSRYPNVIPLALSQAVLTAIILSAFDDRITGRLRVGAAYLGMR